MIWIALGCLALLVAWFLFWGLPRLGASFDTKVRLAVAKDFTDTNPQGADEDRMTYMRRLHWHVLLQCGLPPISIVRVWLSGTRAYVLPPADLIERYLRENVDKPLPSGVVDVQIRNGQGLQILELVRSLED